MTRLTTTKTRLAILAPPSPTRRRHGALLAFLVLALITAAVVPQSAEAAPLAAQPAFTSAGYDQVGREVHVVVNDLGGPLVKGHYHSEPVGWSPKLYYYNGSAWIKYADGPNFTALTSRWSSQYGWAAWAGDWNRSGATAGPYYMWRPATSGYFAVKQYFAWSDGSSSSYWSTFPNGQTYYYLR
jgi:hypothetical protein